MNIQLTNQNYQVIPSNNLSQIVAQLSTNLSQIQPKQSETVQLITYALIATAVVGLFVYHYLKNYEQSPAKLAKENIN